MDEPDAYLSSQGQQDLLRIFDRFAYPADDRLACQRVYVTHAPCKCSRGGRRRHPGIAVEQAG